jgi:hypothetical protein
MPTSPNAEPDIQSPQVGRRSGARARLRLPATLESVRGISRVTIINLSCTGAMIEVPELLKVGTDVVLQRGDLDAFAVVVWAGSGRCGVHFYDPIEEAEVIAYRRNSEHVAGEPDREALARAERWATGTRG